MVTRVSFTACCTASIVYNFGHGSDLPDGSERELKYAIDYSRQCRQALLVATTTAQQTAGHALLEKHGFQKVMDVADVKYPGTSKKLQLWALDLNKKATEALNIAAPVNPFAAAAPALQAAPVAPAAPVRRAVARTESIRDQKGRFIGVGQSFDHDFARPIPQSWAGRVALRFTIHIPAFNGDRARDAVGQSVRAIQGWTRSAHITTSVRRLTRTA